MSNIIDKIQLSGVTYDIGGQGGSGKAIEAGRGISVTTGETADTVSFNLPISAGTGVDSITEGDRTTASGDYSHTEGGYSTANGNYSHAEGMATITYGMSSHAEGYVTEARNKYEHASGAYNVSSSATTKFGHSGNTLFSVGNGTSSSAKHNAFEIRQNGDIYITKDGQDVKLQDQLGGGGGGSSYTAGDGIDITNNVISVTGKVDTNTYTAYTAATDAALATKQTTLTAGTNITIVDNVISATGGGSITVDQTIDRTSENPISNKAISNKATDGNGDVFNSGGRYQWGFYSVGGVGTNKGFWLDKINGEPVIRKYNSTRDLSLVETSAITTSVTSSSTDVQVPSAKAVNDKLGGLSLVKLTQAQYDALATKDSNTLYVING